MHDRSTTDLRLGTPHGAPHHPEHGRPTPGDDDRCPSRFDRWHCGLQRRHGGLHVAEEQQGRTTWNDALDGRDLSTL
jgi:hypothetical protein